ncbi:MAG: protealysin inhibitor emfourin [Nitrospira sp.]
MTRIIFRKSGGILGQETETDIDLNKLPDGTSQELMQLLTESNFFKIPQNMIGHLTPDEQEYTIMVEAGNTHHTVRASDANAPESLRPLLEKLAALSAEEHSSARDE